MGFNGKLAVVTGGAQGIGKEIAQMLVSEGAAVIIGDINLNEAEKTVQVLSQAERHCWALELNLADLESVNGFAKRILVQWGTPDILINNAGILLKEGYLFDLTPSQWDHTMNVNLRGPFFLTQKIAEAMVKKNFGRIVNIASTSAFSPSPQGAVSYDVSKAGIVMLTKNMALQLAPHKITINAVAPGPTITEMTKGLFDDPSSAKRRLERIPAGRLAEPKDIVGAVLFLCSDAAEYITGHTLVIDGGNMLVK